MNRYRQIKQAGPVSRRVGPVVAMLLILFIGLVGTASAARTQNWINWTNSDPGGNPAPITVYANNTFNIYVNGTTSFGDYWQCTKFTFSGAGGVVNDDSPDYTSNGTRSHLHSVKAPSTPGTYNLTVTMYGNDACTTGAGTAVTRNNVVIVQAAPPPNPVNSSPIQVYYVPEPEDHQLQAYGRITTGSISTAASSPIRTYISITISTANMLVYYDQWENGYDDDIANPANIWSVTNTAGTQIWGDNDPSNGMPPGYVTDILNKGDVIQIDNTVPVAGSLGSYSRSSSVIRYDGRDKIGASKPIAVTRLGWPTGPESLLAFANAVFNLSEWGTAYTSPVGCNTPNSFEMFEYAGLSLIAAHDGTKIDIDADANGSYESSVTLNEGQAYLVGPVNNGNCVVNQGARVKTDDPNKPFQAHLFTGDIASNYEGRDLNLIPDDQLSHDYWVPVGVNTGSTNAGPVRLFLYNPESTPLYVRCDTPTAVNLTIPAKSIDRSITLADNQSAHCYAVTTANGTTADPARKFTGLATVDTATSTGTGQAHDWAVPLLPTSSLSTQALVGIAYGRNPNNSTDSTTENGSPLWVTASCETSTWFFVDWDGDGIPDKVDLNGSGSIAGSGTEFTSQNGIQVSHGQSIRFFRPLTTTNGGKPYNTGSQAISANYGQTGAHIWTRTDSGSSGTGGSAGCPFAAAWGQDSRTASTGDPAMDLGTILVPMRGMASNKTSVLLIDANGDGKPNPGDTLRYTITLENVGFDAVIASVYDTIPQYTTYVANSTYRSTPSPRTQIPDSGGGDGFPLDNSPTGYSLGSMPPGAIWTVEFEVKLDAVVPPAAHYESVTNCATIIFGDSQVRACDTKEIAFINSLKVTNYLDYYVSPNVVNPTKTDGWDFSNTVNVTQSGQNANDFMWQDPVTGHASTEGQTQAETSGSGGNSTGETYWQWTPGPANASKPWTSNTQFSETMQPGFKFIGSTCIIYEYQNGVKTQIGSPIVDDHSAAPLDTPPNPVANLNLGPNQFAECEVHHAMFPEVEITITGPAEVAPGEDFDYTIDHKNIGPTDLTDNYIDVKLPDLVKLQDGGKITWPDDGDRELRYEIIDNGPNNDGYGATIRIYGPADCNPDCFLPDLDPDESGKPINVPVHVVDGIDVENLDAEATINGRSENWGPADALDDTSATTPVTVAYFLAAPNSGGVHFEWTTDSETANAGFNLYVVTDGGLVRVNDRPIPSRVGTSQGLQEYDYDAPGVNGAVFYIEDVGLFGQTRLHGPFNAGEPFGARVEPEAIDWAAIAAESDALAQQRESATMAAEGRTGDSRRSAAASQAVEFLVDQDGVYRVTYEQILAAGVDLSRVTRRDLTLTNRGVATPVFISKARFGPGAYIEFIGQALDTMYTDTNVYRLEVSRGRGQRMATQRIRPTLDALNQAPTYYMETLTVEDNNTYSYMAPVGSDPWFDTFMHSWIGTVWEYELSIDNYVSDGPPATLNVSLWGFSNLLPGPDHHTLVALNDQQVAEKVYDGMEIVNVSEQIPPGVLKNGANNMKLTQPVDMGADMDVSSLESYSIVYPRAFVARDGRLTFTSSGSAFKVSNLPSKQVVVYRQGADGTTVKLTGLSFSAQPDGTWEMAFAGSPTAATYYVVAESEVLTPKATNAARVPSNLNGSAKLLVIAHPDFIGGLAPWLAARQAQGYTTKVVNVLDIYAAYNYGIIDAQAIATYIRGAVTNGTEYVVLVGGDTYDYHDYGNNGAFSFIPSLYTATIDGVNFAPVDPLYTDVDGDMVPDAAIGRFPVRTAGELQNLIAKTLQYDNLENNHKAVFAADAGFEQDSNSFASALSDWDITKAYVSGAGGTAAASNTLVAAFNSGPRLVSFVGHSGANYWTFRSDGSLFTATNASALTNVNAPTIVTQFGCWNTYFVEPTFNTMGHQFLLTGLNGAAAVTGSTTLTKSSAERKLGNLMMPMLMTPGATLGGAMQQAKHDLALNHPEMRDVLLGWTVLGDPTLVVRP